MALASRARHATFTPAQVSGFYFRPCRDDHDEVTNEYFRCRCGTVRKQTRRNGYSNLMQHVRREHPDYDAVMLAASTAETGSMLNYVRQSALNVYGWMDWILKTIYHSHSARIEQLEDMNDDALEDYLLLAAATRRLRGLLKDLKKVESLAKALQGLDVTMLDVRVWFDGLLSIKPPYERYIGPLEAIVHSPDFEAACVRVLAGQTNRLSRGEKAALQPFCSPVAKEQNSSEESSADEERSFVEQLQKRRRLQGKEQRYELLSSIHPTSNVAERFFSTARTTYGQERHSLQPITLEMILFLRENSSYWDARTVDDATR
ncbi:Tubby-related protein 3 [Phytophthora cinnamomi]|uniref:Tubby-related protein 3 n=1 Tax=Phytophthora cinnamomi TaxID=4785 RepID=UPI00355A9BF9|nr:Tubby-related protein 3 [Phytophthora cinnamomi]